VASAILGSVSAPRAIFVSRGGHSSSLDPFVKRASVGHTLDFSLELIKLTSEGFGILVTVVRI
jgi:hypothetical protein